MPRIALKLSGTPDDNMKVSGYVFASGPGWPILYSKPGRRAALKRRKATTMKTRNKMNIAIVAMALAPILAPFNAFAFTPRIGTRVAQVTESIFEVVPNGVGSGGGSAFWCGASDYARLTLGAGWKTKIYIARGLGPSVTTGRRSAVQFTLDPAAAGISSTSAFLNRNSLKTGESMTVQRGHHLCEQNPTRG